MFPNPLQIDIEHNCADGQAQTDEPPQTGGYAKLEIRAGVPFLTFDWSAVPQEQIRTRQRLFLSPEYEVDKTTGEIVRLIRVSLVGDPGTHHARMLATAKTVRAERNGTMDLSMILAALRAAMAAEDPAVAKESIANLVAEIENAAGGAAPSAPEAAAAEDPKDPVEAAADDEKEPVEAAADDDKEKEPVAAKKKIAAKTASKVDPAIALAKEFDAFKRDQLLKEQGHRLQEGQRVWASRQPYATVTASRATASPRCSSS